MDCKQSKGKACPDYARAEILFDIFPWGVIIFAPDGKVVFANEKIEELMGLSLEDLRGCFLEDIFPQQELQKILQCEQNEVCIEALRLREKQFYVRTERCRGMFDGHMLLWIACRDELKKLFKNNKWYRELEDELNMILEYSYDGIFITDGCGRVRQMNKACERIENVKAEDIIGKNMKELVKKGFYSESVSMRVMEEKKPVTLIQKLRNGKEIMVTGTPVFKKGKLVKVITNERDITELNLLKRQLEEKSQIAMKYERELEHLRTKNASFDDVVARSQAMRNLIQMALKLADVDATILIQGESGVGKEVLAKIIYKNSNRQNGPFIDINCGAIPETLLESELFGYEKGSFTGARKEGKAGLIELANGGILFLDEIGELPLSLQVKLLRFLQEKKIMRVGGIEDIPVDVRVIAATNRDLQEAVEKGNFRADLFYRLNVVPLAIPPLRQRKEDIEPLAYHFLSKFNKKYGLDKELSMDAIKVLLSYEWPGNVRELENLIERAVITCAEKVIKPEYLGRCFVKVSQNRLDDIGLGPVTLKEAMEKFERSFLLRMMSYYNGTVEMAEALGIDRSTLTRKFKRYNIEAAYKND